MIYDVIERLGDSLEDIALMLHKPQQALYIVVREDGTYRKMNEEKFDYNSKFSYWDFWSNLLSMNQPVDKKKIIQSNNKYSFFVKDFGKLTNEIIENYYENTGLDKNNEWIKKWILEHVMEFDNGKKNELVKFFFYAAAEDYKHEGERYIKEKCLRNTKIYNDIEYGSGVGITENAKKPFLENKTRKTVYRERVGRELAYKKALFFNMLKSCIRRGKNYIYITEDGKVFPCDVCTPVEINVAGGILFVVRMDEKGNLIFDLMEPIIGRCAKTKEEKSDIKAVREKMGYTQKELSEVLGIPLRTIEKWERGERKPADYIEKMILEKLYAIQMDNNY